MGTNDVKRRSWTVLEHGPITRIANNLWRVEGALPRMSLRRTMTVVRLDGGELVLHSPIALSHDAMAELEQMGDIAYAVLPNAGHTLDVPRYHARYPRLRFFVPASGLEETRAIVPNAESLESFPSQDTVRFEPLDGVKKEAEAAMIVRSSDGTAVVLCDTVHNMDRKRDVLGFIMTTLMGSAGRPRVSRAVRLFYIDDASAFRAHLERLAHIPDLARLIVNHEKLSEGPQARLDLMRAAATLPQRKRERTTLFGSVFSPRGT